jgi:hypothetical protein
MCIAVCARGAIVDVGCREASAASLATGGLRCEIKIKCIKMRNNYESCESRSIVDSDGGVCTSHVRGQDTPHNTHHTSQITHHTSHITHQASLPDNTGPADHSDMGLRGVAGDDWSSADARGGGGREVGVMQGAEGRGLLGGRELAQQDME